MRSKTTPATWPPAAPSVRLWPCSPGSSGIVSPAWWPRSPTRVYRAGRDEHEQCREHVRASLQASPWARVIKASDFTDNADGLTHTTRPMLQRLAGKYG